MKTAAKFSFSIFPRCLGNGWLHLHLFSTYVCEFTFMFTTYFFHVFFLSPLFPSEPCVTSLVLTCINNLPSDTCSFLLFTFTFIFFAHFWNSETVLYFSPLAEISTLKASHCSIIFLPPKLCFQFIKTKSVLIPMRLTLPRLFMIERTIAIPSLF